MIVLNSKTTHYVIYHYYDGDPNSGRVPDLEIDIKDAEHILLNGRLLSVFQTCVSALYDEGLSLTVTGEDNE